VCVSIKLHCKRRKPAVKELWVERLGARTSKTVGEQSAVGGVLNDYESNDQRRWRPCKDISGTPRDRRIRRWCVTPIGNNRIMKESNRAFECRRQKSNCG